jgi:hypothetical protein
MCKEKLFSIIQSFCYNKVLLEMLLRHLLICFNTEMDSKALQSR